MRPRSNFSLYRLFLVPLIFLYFMPCVAAQTPNSLDRALSTVGAFFGRGNEEKKSGASEPDEIEKDEQSSVIAEVGKVGRAVSNSVKKTFSYVGDLFDKSAAEQEAKTEEAVPAAFSKLLTQPGEIFMSCPGLPQDTDKELLPDLEQADKKPITKRLKKIIVNSLAVNYILYDANPLFLPGNEQHGSHIYPKI